MTGLVLKTLPLSLVVVRLEPDAEVPGWACEGAFSSVTRTADELSMVCESDRVPAGLRAEPGWRALVVQGPLQFDQVGILAGLAGVLAAQGVSIFAISTYDTDYVLLKHDQLATAVGALEEAGHKVIS